MSVRLLLAPPEAVYALVAAGGGIGTGRTVPTAAAVLGLAGVVVGGLARARRRRAGALVALAAGLTSAIVGGLHVANAAGGLGTGNGLAGAVAALVLGLVGTVVGGLALARSRCTSSGAERRVRGLDLDRG